VLAIKLGLARLKMRPIHEAGWILETASDADIDEIMTWFPDARSVDIWGGPGFRFPFTPATFREDCQVDRMDSYALRDRAGRLAAFGQSYERAGRGHLARLIASPTRRRRGAGRQLIRMIIASLDERHAYEEYSLFVYRDNVPAYRCYRDLGFAVTDYPPDAKMADKCYFLLRRGKVQ
jgi:ribosomal protein S18 acetylase RimI-like enzyme